MPKYQYACRSCGHEFEATHGFHDPAVTECTECGGPVRKVFSAVGVVFKGSGFYRTDSRGGNKSASEPALPKTETPKPSTSSDSASSSSSSTPSSSSSGSSSTTPSGS